MGVEKYRTKIVRKCEFVGRWFLGWFWVGFWGGFLRRGIWCGMAGAKWVSKGNGQNGVCGGLVCGRMARGGLVCVVWLLCMVVVMVRRWLVMGL